MLSSIPDDYLPRTNYVPACSPEEYQKRTPRVPWEERKSVIEFYRIISRTMISSSAERTLISAIIPKIVGHIDLGFSITFKEMEFIPLVTSLFSSTPYDFFIKSTGKNHFRNDVAQILPLPEITNSYRHSLSIRALILNCITNHYSDLWSECWREEFKCEEWSKKDPRLSNEFFKNLSNEWYRDCVLRTDYARRQALVEIDVLAAMALGLSLEELKTIYRIQFPVLQAYEKETYYDQQGQIVFTTNKGLTDVGLSRGEWKEAEYLKSGSIDKKVIDNTIPTGPVELTITYHAPFNKCDREKDYETAWKEFEKRLK